MDDFFDEYSCSLLEDEEPQSFQAFPEPTHNDFQPQDCQAMFMQRDATMCAEPQPEAQYYRHHDANICAKDIYQKVEAKDQNDQDDEDTTQPSPIPSYTPSTAEDYAVPTPYDASVFAFNPHEAKLESSVRAPFEKIICDDESLQSRGLAEFPMERDPAEEAFAKNLISGITNPCMFLDLKNFDLRPTWQTMEEKMEDILEIPSPKNPLTSTPSTSASTSTKKKASRAKKTSVDEDEDKPKNSRQSKYKNAYSLAVEQVKRLISDWFEMTMGYGTKKFKQEEEKSNQVRIEEEKLILIEIDKYEAAERKITEINEKITSLQNLKKIRPDQKAELDMLIKERNSLPIPSESEKKALLEKLSYKRFGLIPYLSQLINDDANAFVRRAEIPALLKEFPKKRTLKCMREYFSEKIKFGLIISRVAIEFLSQSQDTCEEWELMSRPSIALKYWLFKTHMKPKTKDLFLNKDSKNHIQNAIKEVYFELEDLASKKLSEHDLKLYEKFLEDYGQKLSPIPAFERDIFKIWSRADLALIGKRAAKELENQFETSPSSEKKAKKTQSRKKVCQTH